MRLKYLFACLSWFSILFSWAQTSPKEVFDKVERSGGVYYAYPYQEIGVHSAPPKGYKPFYISHLGRHGSRYLIDDADYKNTLDLLASAESQSALTPLGKDVYHRLLKVWDEVEWRGGDLSPLGVREQRGIAERMFERYPEVFRDEANITAYSTTIVRCVLSMDAFSERLKESNPKLHIYRDASVFHQRYLNHHTEEAIAFRSAKDTWREEYRKFEDQHIQPDALMTRLFSDSNFVRKKVNPKEVMIALFEIANNMQNIETDVSFYDIFEKQELFDLWQCKNYKLYVNDANAALNGGLMFENCKPLLKQMIADAENMIDNGGYGANFRFAHDGNIIPLVMLLHLKDTYNSVDNPADFYKAWSDFKIAPMAGNVQLVFYKHEKTKDILVKFLLHENEITVPPIAGQNLPYYYRWEDVKAFYLSLINEGQPKSK